ncbi:hypothetical protein [Myceligenerans pegani]|uniref:DUF998 domain-containing protein n=1 Tax=Myceligenerans pegani TaxID=2776917 RepID=A0ABR9N532_9MICO|nr:hypothetical protein [Myceligenerans sp. TRM 65318]MBE1878774.1 hypothetical protein [Myceligenerans sp. TRM 65318]MBE3021045.1 hypothetical protein [Myceligenerans sp. TRM 65318]
MAQTQGVSLTYRYLRVGIVSMVLALFAALALQISADRASAGPGEEWWLASISTYFYTPVQNILVGVTVVVGLCLIAIKGRDGEDVLLNFAGMMAFLAGVVPTPLRPDACAGEPYCLEVPERVANNVGALLIAGLAVLVLATWPRRRHLVRRDGWDLWATWAVWAVVAGWHLAWPTSFLGWAHYVAAVLLFLCLIAVAWVNGRDVAVTSGPDERTRGLSPDRYRRTYRVVAVAMLAVLIVGLGVHFGFRASGWALPPQTLFTVEALLLLLFAVFWVLQTIEFWEIGLPAKARTAE